MNGFTKETPNNTKHHHSFTVLKQISNSFRRKFLFLRLSRLKSGKSWVQLLPPAVIQGACALKPLCTSCILFDFGCMTIASCSNVVINTPRAHSHGIFSVQLAS